jgi:hypothetical protein
MLYKHIREIFQVFLTVENFSLSVDDIFLQVNCDGFRRAEILHGIRYLDPEFIADPEKVVDRDTAVEHNCRKIKQIDPGGPEFLARNALDTDKLEKIQINLVFFSYLEIWGFFCGRLRLGDQYSLNFQVFIL